MPNLAAYLARAPIFDWCVVRFERTQRSVLDRDWATGSKICYSLLTINSRIDSQENGGLLIKILALLTLKIVATTGDIIKFHRWLLKSHIT